MPTVEPGRPIEILLVEDSPGDVRLAQEVFLESKVINNLSVARDGEEALAFLKKKGDFHNSPTPDIILLDLNLPRIDGREVLTEIKNDPKLMRIPVVVLTMSDAETDIVRSYNLRANCYIKKPLELNGFIEIIKAVENFWLSIVKLPDR